MTRKKIAILSLICLLLFFIIIIVSLLAIKSDYRFIISEKLASLSRSADCEIVDIQYVERSLDDLYGDSSVKFDDSLLLINSSYMLSNEYVPDIVSYKDVLMSGTIVDSYVSLADSVMEKYGKSLYIISSYRTAEEQEDIVNQEEEDVAAKVGASEHQSGLALDVYVSGYSGKAFIKCEEGRYVNTHCYEYGFIIRYPYGEKSITGITYEPWHIRYVGYPHAELIYMNSLTLEEYITSFFKDNVFYEYDNYIISRQKESVTLMIPEDCKNIVISPDNTGYYIITAEKNS